MIVRTMENFFFENIDWIYTTIYTNNITIKAKFKIQEVHNMKTAKIFENGRSQAVRLPKECRFDTNEVAINRIGDIVLLMPVSNKWISFMQAIDMFSDDFMQERDEYNKQEREEL